jgi:hypothetical protein
MRELKLEDCKVGMTLKLKEGCPFREKWIIDLNIQITCVVTYRSNTGIRVKFQNMDKYRGVPIMWNFYIDYALINFDDYELISKNLEYPNKRKNNYY